MIPRPPLPGPRAAQLQADLTAPLDIIGGTAFGRYPSISTEQTYNMMISDNALVNFPGYTAVKVINPAGNGREIYNSVLLGQLVVVMDSGVFLVDSNFLVTHVGTLATSIGKVFISDNFASQICIVDGVNIYVYNYLTNVFTTITGTSVGFKPGYITYQDTYFIASDLSTNQWRLSLQNDGTQWPVAAQFVGELQSKPNKCVATVALDRQLLVMGQTVTEPWYDLDYNLFPYQRSNSYAIDYGCLSSETIAVGYGRAVWLASNEKSGPAIMVAQENSQPQQISNDGLDYLFSQLTAPNDSYGFLCKVEGHIMYVITFVTDNHSFVYDFNTNTFFTLTDEKLDYFIAKRIAFFQNAYYFISFTDGVLYKLGSEHTTYAGKEIPRIRICTPIRFGDSARFIPKYIALTMESGINTYEGGIDFSVSRDGGFSYGHIVRQKMPSLGKRKNIINFYNIGSVNDCVMKFSFWGFGRTVCTGAYAGVYS